DTAPTFTASGQRSRGLWNHSFAPIDEMNRPPSRPTVAADLRLATDAKPAVFSRPRRVMRMRTTYCRSATTATSPGSRRYEPYERRIENANPAALSARPISSRLKMRTRCTSCSKVIRAEHGRRLPDGERQRARDAGQIHRLPREVEEQHAERAHLVRLVGHPAHVLKRFLDDAALVGRARQRVGKVLRAAQAVGDVGARVVVLLGEAGGGQTIVDGREPGSFQPRGRRRVAAQLIVRKL